MTVTKKVADRAVTVVAAVAAPVLTLLVHVHTLSSLTATDLGAIFTAALVAYHGGAIAQDRLPSSPAPAEFTEQV